MNTKLTTKAVCYACGQSVTCNRGTLAHHGFTISHGYGFRNGSCIGANLKPIETSTQVLEYIIKIAPQQIERINAAVANGKLSAGEASVNNAAWQAMATKAQADLAAWQPSTLTTINEAVVKAQKQADAKATRRVALAEKIAKKQSRIPVLEKRAAKELAAGYPSYAQCGVEMWAGMIKSRLAMDIEYINRDIAALQRQLDRCF